MISILCIKYKVYNILQSSLCRIVLSTVDKRQDCIKVETFLSCYKVDLFFCALGFVLSASKSEKIPFSKTFT